MIPPLPDYPRLPQGFSPTLPADQDAAYVATMAMATGPSMYSALRRVVARIGPADAVRSLVLQGNVETLDDVLLLQALAARAHRQLTAAN
jgi:hypothetical protein